MKKHYIVFKDAEIETFYATKLIHEKGNPYIEVFGRFLFERNLKKLTIPFSAIAYITEVNEKEEIKNE